MKDSPIDVLLWLAETEAQAISLQTWLESSSMAAAEVVPHGQQFLVGVLVNAETREQLESLLPLEAGLERLELPALADHEFLLAESDLRRGFSYVGQLLVENVLPAIQFTEGMLRISVTAAETAKARELLPRTKPASALVEIDFSNTTGELSEGQERIPNQSLVAWPLCPECGRGRTTVCSHCGMSGTEFPRADQVLVDELAPDELFVICPQCDEPMVPKFYRRCEWCSHVFEDGLPSPRERQHRLRSKTDEKLNPRAWITIGGLLGLAVFFFVYFSWVTQ